MFGLFGTNKQSQQSQQSQQSSVTNKKYYSFTGGSNNKYDNLKDLIKNNLSVVRYHSNYCGHCIAMKEEWEKLINALDGKKIIIVDLEAETMNTDFVPDEYTKNIQGYPTIVKYLNGKEQSQYNGNRTKDAMMEWLNNIEDDDNGNNGKIFGGNKKRKSKSSRKSRKSNKTRKSRKSRKSNKTRKSRKSRKSLKSRKSRK